MTSFERLFQIMTRSWVVFVWMLLTVVSFLYADRPVAYFVNTLDLKHSFPWLQLLTGSGVWVLCAIFLVGGPFCCRYVFRHKRAEMCCWFLSLCFLVSCLVCLCLKMSLGRARPELLISENLFGFYGFQTHSLYWSFPSAHTSAIMALAFGCCALFPRYCVAFIASGLLVALSRIVMVKHFVSDVMFASYLALLEVGLLYFWVTSSRYFQKLGFVDCSSVISNHGDGSCADS